MNKFALLISITLLAACTGTSPADEAAAGVKRSVSEVAISSGTPVTKADLSISGMTCEMMCGGAIKDAMAELPGVVSTEIKFTEIGKESHAVVTYDPAKVSDAEMVKKIEALHEGQYKVLAVGITKEVLKVGATQEPAPQAETQQVNAEVPGMVLPDLVSLLGRLLRI